MSASRGQGGAAGRVLGLAAVALAAVGAGGYLAWDWYGLWSAMRSTEPATIQAACYQIAERGAAGFLDELIALLNRSGHDDVREAAGYALARIGHPRGTGPLAAAIQRQDDDIIRAKLICYWSQLAGEAAEPTLRQWLAGQEVWRAAGAAVALSRRGHAHAADVLLDQADCDEPLRRQFCAGELTKLAGPMSEMVGAGLDLSTDGRHGFSADQIAALRAWWAGPRTPQLLRDHLAWHSENNPRWRLIKRMLHARERAEGWVGLKG